jgi:ribosomal protein S27AE
VERFCPKCQTAMTQGYPNMPVQKEGKLVVFKEPVKALGPNVGSPLTAYVCSRCGFVEWYADHPERFAAE